MRFHIAWRRHLVDYVRAPALNSASRAYNWARRGIRTRDPGQGVFPVCGGVFRWLGEWCPQTVRLGIHFFPELLLNILLMNFYQTLNQIIAYCFINNTHMNPSYSSELHLHPHAGGEQVLRGYAGRDITEIFKDVGHSVCMYAWNGYCLYRCACMFYTARMRAYECLQNRA